MIKVVLRTLRARTYLYGAGGHGKVVREIVEAGGGKVAAFIDDNAAVNEVAGLPVLHSAEGCQSVVVSIGNNRDRKRVAESLGNVEFPSFVHPSAVVSPSARIGRGTVVMPGAVVNADAVVGDHCIVNTGASVGHDCSLADFCHVASHATLCGGVHLEEGVWIGAAAVVNQGLKAGAWSTVGSGSAVTGDVMEGDTVAGVPAVKICHSSGE